VVFGPDLVTLEPNEKFPVVYLSGGKPKRPNVIQTLHVSLGPDFFSDIFFIDTSDHAKLELQLSYNWHFNVDPKDPETAFKIFKIKDFVGGACSAIASRVRGEVAGVDLEEFHKLSARHIRKAIFGLDKDGKVIDQFVFPDNNLIVTNVDIQRVEPIDEMTKQALRQQVTTAIEITTAKVEAEGKKDADRIEQ